MVMKRILLTLMDGRLTMRNLYHPIINPNGVIQMGLAENQLSFDLIQEWIQKNPKALICIKEGISSFKDVAIFQDYHDLLEFRH
ncbi:hypothetical protein RJ641_016600, partial [Dillenia turbinata]